MIVKDLANLGYNKVVFRCDNELSILALLGAVKLAQTGDVVQETSAEVEPQSNGAAESSVNVVKGHVRSIKLAVESASGVEVPADHDLLTWLVPYAASMHRRFAVGRDGKTAFERNVGRRAVLRLAQLCERVWWMPLKPSNRRLGPLDSRFEQGRYLGPMDGSNTELVGTAGGVVKARTIKRLPPGERWAGSLLDEARGSCVATTCGSFSTLLGAWTSAIAQKPTSSSLATETIALDVPTQKTDHKQTMDHSEQCSSRMEAILMTTTVERMRLERAGRRSAQFAVVESSRKRHRLEGEGEAASRATSIGCSKQLPGRKQQKQRFGVAACATACATAT